MVIKEESKSSFDNASQLNNAIFPCFSFYNHINSLHTADIQIKTDFKYQITHPFEYDTTPIPVEDMYKYKVTLKLCTLLKGVPYGPAHI
jgi:hypothetical protein